MKPVYQVSQSPWNPIWHRRFGAVVLLPLAALAVWAAAVRADLGTPTPADRQVALAVTSILPQGHLTRHKLDDEISRRGLDMFLKSLDPMKLYFMQADIDGFRKYQDRLDDDVRRGDIGLAYAIYNVVLQRIDQRLKLAEELLAVEPDFTLDEEMVVDRDLAQYARNEAEAREIWRKRIKFDFLMQRVEGKSMQEAREALGRRYRSLGKRMHQTDRNELLETFLSSLTMAYDPHTSYMSPASLENFDIMMRLELDGIGAALQSEDGYTKVAQVVPGGPADRDGRLKEEDRVIGVGQGVGGEIEDVVDMKLSDVVKRIRGKRGTIVVLKVIPAGETAPVLIDLTRDQIALKDGEAQSAVFEMGTKPDGTPYRLGMIDLPSFYMDMEGARRHRDDYKSTTRDVRKILADFRSKQVDAVIMDLRRNGGGSLTEAIHLTGLFIDQGPIVQVKGFDGEVQHYDDMEAGVDWDGPLAVLISKQSASASEIFAGAIQDYGRGLIIGDPATHGKGTVQTLREIGPDLFPGLNPPKMGALKLTMQQFYRPNGDSTQNRGVLADVELPSLTAHFDNGESDLDYAVPFDRVPPAKYAKVGFLDRVQLDQLSQLSAARRQASADFQKEQGKIDRFLEQKNRKTISLNEERFKAERAAIEAEKEQEEKLEKLERADHKGIERDFYLDEAMAITLDYLKLVRVAQN